MLKTVLWFARAILVNGASTATPTKLSRRSAVVWRSLTVGAMLMAGAAPREGLASSLDLKWEDLVPPQIEVANPLESLTQDQWSELRVVILSRELSATGNPPPKMEEQAHRAEKALVSQGLDVESLVATHSEIMQTRMAAAETLNTSLDGKPVRMPGYLLPLTFDGTKAVDFLLVPYVGACIHVPPPPPNQIVYVRFESGYEVRGLYAPVWVEGTMTVGSSERRLSLVDGVDDIPVGYNIDALVVERYDE